MATIAFITPPEHWLDSALVLLNAGGDSCVIEGADFAVGEGTPAIRISGTYRLMPVEPSASTASATLDIQQRLTSNAAPAKWIYEDTQLTATLDQVEDEGALEPLVFGGSASPLPPNGLPIRVKLTGGGTPAPSVAVYLSLWVQRGTIMP